MVESPDSFRNLRSSIVRQVGDSVSTDAATKRNELATGTLGNKDLARQDSEQAAVISDALRRLCWSKELGLIADTPDRNTSANMRTHLPSGST